MHILANVSIALAAFIYLLPLQLLMHDAGRKTNDSSGVVWGAIFLLVPLWLLLVTGLLGATARGGLDWLPVRRGPQYLIVVVAGVAMLVLVFFSLMGKVEHPNHLPWASRPFHVWAVHVFPLVVMAFVLVAVNPSLRAGLPPLATRLPMVAVAACSLLAGAGMLVQWVFHAQRQQAARVQRAIAEDDERDRMILERVQALDTQRDFAELLGHASRHEEPEIRNLAIAKAQAHPDFTDAITRVLRGPWPRQALIYLDACDVPDRQALAGPVRDAFIVLTADARDAVERTHTFHVDQFDWVVRDMLAVADKYADLGVDYVPAIRDYRGALDSQRTHDVRLNARHTLDAWLAAHTDTVTASR